MESCPHCGNELSNQTDTCPNCNKNPDSKQGSPGNFNKEFWITLAGTVGVFVTSFLFGWINIIFGEFKVPLYWFDYWGDSARMWINFVDNHNTLGNIGQAWIFADYQWFITARIFMSILSVLLVAAIAVLIISLIKQKSISHKFTMLGFGLTALVSVIFMISMLSVNKGLGGSGLTWFPLITLLIAVVVIRLLIKQYGLFKPEHRENPFLRVCNSLWKNYSIVIVCVLLFIVFGIIEERFLQFNNIILILRHSSIVGMIALGMTFVIITGGIDLSSGHVVAFAGAGLIFIQGNEAIPLSVAIPLAIAAAIIIAIVVGFINGSVITKLKIPAFIATLAIGIIVRSLTKYFLGGSTARGRMVPEFTDIGLGGIGPIPYSLIIWIVSAIILGCVLKFTKFGSYIYAVGGNENAARYSGIKVNKIKILAYSLAGLCVGIATVLDMSRMAAISPSMAGEGYEFDAITAVVVGGTSLAGGRGRMIGTVFGMILVTVVTNLMIMTGFSPLLSGAVKGLIILTAVLLQRKD